MKTKARFTEHNFVVPILFTNQANNSSHAWCHPELVSGSNRRGSSSTADPDLHQDDTVDDDSLDKGRTFNLL